MQRRDTDIEMGASCRCVYAWSKNHILTQYVHLCYPCHVQREERQSQITACRFAEHERAEGEGSVSIEYGAIDDAALSDDEYG